MGSTVRRVGSVLGSESPRPTTRWRVWPLADGRLWSWSVVLVIAAIAALVGKLADSWLLGLLAAGALIATLWQFFLPVTFEICSLGIRRQALSRRRLVPWHAVRAYMFRPGGIVLLQCSDPVTVDFLNSLFVPNPPDADELLSAVRLYLSHAKELPS